MRLAKVGDVEMFLLIWERLKKDAKHKYQHENGNCLILKIKQNPYHPM